jgi:prolyl-tRNA editing enzyme YbaK/EbsC (Cys-tRNA(Pro) deacylase)
MPAVERVRACLIELGISEPRIAVFPERTATAEQAAAAIGTSVERIVKSLVFMAGAAPVLALVSGANRADVSRLAELTGAPITRATPDQVRDATGFAIGGVPPIAHPSPLKTILDRALLQYDEVWASAGTPTSVFALTPATLVSITNAEVADIT